MKIDGLDRLISQLQTAGDGGLKSEYQDWLEDMGLQFLDIIQDELIKENAVDTGRLLRSFTQGDKENHFLISKGGLTLEVGTQLEYASYVNDGHATSSSGERRWVPGRWTGSRFEYDPNASTGMMLASQWIDGNGYWDHAVMLYEQMFEQSLDRKLQSWFDRHFGR
ncbi:HK97 gp10 family phage protein [Bacillus safensis]|uniref:HK97 gp10 family phage protein n=1 Tax=Bacillus TaxID=1386 RepID=UPI00125D3E3B|nr:HK97 gp10 family phage protein [Bacillus safensis]KAB3536384.1 HK97 gp10 family phage protein [Bacillus safensis]KAB3543311.1 HK97 gp10 family phage protein [Bacillus safensis]